MRLLIIFKAGYDFNILGVLHAPLRQVRRSSATIIGAAIFLGACLVQPVAANDTETEGRDWLSVGRTQADTHYSPLNQVNRDNISQLGLAWYLDLPGEGALQATPLAVGGTLFFSGSNGRVYAVDGRTGHRLWTFNPELALHPVDTRAVLYGGNRGVAYFRNKIFVGTVDGRLLALDSHSGREIWAVDTFEHSHMPQTITGAPRLCDGNVLIGFRGSSGARGYITAYNADSGKQAWRFYTVPGNPANGYENAAMRRAAKTWSGEWWKGGGNGAVWDGITCDAHYHQVYVGTGDAHTERDDPKDRSVTGDLLFSSSIVALDAHTGQYKWHYQEMPHDYSEYDAALQLILSDINVKGKSYPVVIQAAKNGFLYVIDRVNGRLLSANPFEKVTWAKQIDLASGRPVEVSGWHDMNYPLDVYPVSLGAHSWQPAALNTDTNVLYIPTSHLGIRHGAQPSVLLDRAQDQTEASGGLVAWDVKEERERWGIHYSDSFWNGGLLATAGDLVFQGTGSGHLFGYDAANGKRLWDFSADQGIIAAPMAWSVGGQMYISVLTGYGTFSSIARYCNYGWHFNEQSRRLLTFALGTHRALPANQPARTKVRAVDSPTLTIDAIAASLGQKYYASRQCSACHGVDLENSQAVAPDLRESRLAEQEDRFRAVVLGGMLANAGMPKFGDISDDELHGIFMYIRQRAHEAATNDRSDSNLDKISCKAGSVH